MKRNEKDNSKLTSIISMSIISIILLCFGINIWVSESRTKLGESDIELAKSMSYARAEGNTKVNECVDFETFFLRDLDGDGYADKILGTSKEIGQNDTLYFNISVSSEGYIKDGVIKINAENFTLATAIVKDDIVKNNVISNDAKQIELNRIYAGTTKLLMGRINNKINSKFDYSRVSQIVFEATYVNENSEEERISKTVDLQVDWYGSVENQIKTDTEVVYASDIVNEEQQTLDVKFKLITEETKKQLILTQNTVKGIIPELNGYKPSRVTIEGKNGTLKYDKDTGEFEITRIGRNISNLNTYTMIVTYPLEAYMSNEEGTTTILIPVESCYIGDNNPNPEFENPVVSNIANRTITIIIEKVKSETGERFDFDVSIGKYTNIPTGRNVISKKLPLKRYSGEIIEENTEYTVQWKVKTGKREAEGLKFEQTNEDKIHNSKTGEDISMAEFTNYTGIYIVSADSVFGEDGYIKVIDVETSETIHTFTNNDWNKYTEQNSYKYEQPVRNIRIETSKPISDKTLMINNIKEIEDGKIVDTYDEIEFEDLSNIRTYLTGKAISDPEYVENVDKVANYEREISIASINIANKEISTQDTEENAIITIETQTSGYNTAKWKNGMFLVKFPTNIAYAEINTIRTNNSNVEILGYELYKGEENYFIKILTSNENEESYQIIIDSNLQPDPRVVTESSIIELYAINENCETYPIGYREEDIYDLNANQDNNEIVGYNKTDIKLVAPESLTVAQMASEYDEKGSTTLAPQVAEIIPEVIVESKEQTAKITLQLRNNYQRTISETVVLGKIPFKGNIDPITGKDLGSNYTATIEEGGIQIPENLQGKVKIYYSTNPEPTSDIDDENNKWTTTPEKWSEVKTFLIDFENYILQNKEECVFTYKVRIPENVNYNQISYSAYKAEFYLDTENGKLYQQVSPRKLGFRIARKYDLKLTKYKKASAETLKGVTFKLTQLNENNQEEENRIRTTDENGILNVENLYVEKTYILQEIKTLPEYDLEKTLIKFTSVMDKQTGELQIILLEGNFKDNKIEIEQVGKEEKEKRPIVHVALENEVKYNLVINKTDLSTNEQIRGVKFQLEQEDNTRIYTTNSQGQINIKGISIGKEYTLTETESKGYYLIKPIKFIVTRNNLGKLELNVTNDNGENVVYELEETVEGTVCPKLTLNIKNEQIPTYNFKILKIAEQLELETDTGDSEEKIKQLEGAQFELYSKDLQTKEIYTTDAEGNIFVQGLYEYVEGKEISGEYTLKEIYAPAGYSINETELIFRVQRNGEGRLILTVLEGDDLIANRSNTDKLVYDKDGKEIENKLVTIEAEDTGIPTIGITVENKDIFSIQKVDKETGEPLAGAKFVIYKLDENNAVVDYAKDNNGNVLGILENVNGQSHYVLTTNSAGQITANIGEGYYKAIEVATPAGYIFEPDESERTYYFGIGKGKPAERVVSEIYNKAEAEVSGNIEYRDVVITSDGGEIIVGDFSGYVRIPAEKTVSGEEIQLQALGNFSDEILIKYNADKKIEWAVRNGVQHTETMISVIKISNSEILTLGTRGIAGNSFVCISKFNEETGELLEENVDISIGNSVSPSEIIQTKDKGYVIVGDYRTLSIPEKATDGLGEINKNLENRNGGIILKLNSDLKVEWYDILEGNTGNSRMKSVAELSNGEIVTCMAITEGNCEINGETINFTSGVAVVKYNLQGELEKLIQPSGLDEYNKIVSNEDEYVIIGRKSYSGEVVIGENEMIVNSGIVAMNFDNMDNLKWIYQSNLGYYATPLDIEELSDGSYAIGGSKLTGSEQKRNNTIVIKIDSEGKEVWRDERVSYTDDEVRAIKAKENTIIAVGKCDGEEELTKEINAVILEYDLEKNIVWSDSISKAIQTFNQVIATKDGGSIAVGKFEGKLEIKPEFTITNDKIELASKGYTDSLIIKYNSEGKVEWVKAIQGGSENEFLDIKETNQGYIVVGSLYSNGSLGSSRISKIPAQDTVNGEEIQLETKGSMDMLIAKYTEEGKIEWAKTIGTTGWDVAQVVENTNDGGYIIGGRLTNKITIDEKDTVSGEKIEETFTNGDAGLIKFDKDDKVEFVKKLYINVIEITGIIEKEEGGYVLSGAIRTGTHFIPSTETVSGESIEMTVGAGSQADAFMMRYNEDMKLQDITVIQPINAGSYDSFHSLEKTKDGGYVTVWTGYNPIGIVYPAESTQTGQEMTIRGKGSWTGYIFKYDEDGKLEWVKEIEEKGSDYRDIAQTKDGGYIISSNTVIKRLDSNLDEIWSFNQNAKKFDCINGQDIYTAGSRSVNGIDTLAIGKIQETILAPEMPATQKINVENQKMKYIITGRVEGEGGTIVIGANKPNETVKHGENSIEDIVITPEENYQIKTITINGENYEFTTEIDGSYIMPKFENVQQDKNIVVTSSKILDTSNVVVQHYLWENGSVTTTKVAEDEKIIGEIGEKYTTAPKIDLAKYEIITNEDYYGESIPEGLEPKDYYIPENATGSISEGTIVRYYYKPISYKLTIHHYLDGTKTSLVPDVEKNNIESGTAYQTSVEKTPEQKYVLNTILNETQSEDILEIDSKRYKILSIEGNEAGTIEQNTEVTYYYTDTSFDITVQKVWEDNENAKNTRPEELVINLLKNREEFEQGTLNIAEGEDTYVFETLYKYDENDKEITYDVQENIPEGYYLRNIAREDNKYIITNSKLGSIQINKIDKMTKKPLKDSQIAIAKKDENDVWKLIETVTTNEEGLAKLENLEYGTYRITEVVAPEGYNLNSNSQEIELNETNIDTSVVITNKAKTLLPQTGGSGIYLLMIIGTIVIISGVIISKKEAKK